MAGLISGPVRTSCLEEVRSVIALSGTGLLHFLQGIVTNNVLSLEPPGAPPLYTCILSAQGRHQHDLILHRTHDATPTVLADVDRRGAADLLRLLRRYRLRQKVDIEDVSQQYRVWARFGGTADDLRTAAAAPPPGWATDPRLPHLGLRAVLPASAASAADGGGGAQASWQDHRRWRLLHGVAEGDQEMPTGEVVPLEFNIDGLHGISFTKGCYVGQELMARTHFKGVVRKRLMPCILAPGSAGDPPPAPDMQLRQAGGWALPAAAAAAADDADGGSQPAQGVRPGAAAQLEQAPGRRRSVGVLRVADGALGLAVLRLAQVEAAAAAGQPLVVGDGASCMNLWPWRPAWWPESWGHEEGAATAGNDP